MENINLKSGNGNDEFVHRDATDSLSTNSIAVIELFAEDSINLAKIYVNHKGEYMIHSPDLLKAFKTRLMYDKQFSEKSDTLERILNNTSKNYESSDELVETLVETMKNQVTPECDKINNICICEICSMVKYTSDNFGKIPKEGFLNGIIYDIVISMENSLTK